jgi:hypothetical protein
MKCVTKEVKFFEKIKLVIDKQLKNINIIVLTLDFLRKYLFFTSLVTPKRYWI